jgi:hypothetical protein
MTDAMRTHLPSANPSCADSAWSLRRRAATPPPRCCELGYIVLRFTLRASATAVVTASASRSLPRGLETVGGHHGVVRLPGRTWAAATRVRVSLADRRVFALSQPPKSRNCSNFRPSPGAKLDGYGGEEVEVTPVIYVQPQPEGMSGPFPATEFPRLDTRGFPAADDGNAGWRMARRWAASPELEWTFQVMVQRINACSGQMPALFYEPLSDFDVTRRLLRFSAHLRSRVHPRPAPPGR